MKKVQIKYSGIKNKVFFSPCQLWGVIPECFVQHSAKCSLIVYSWNLLIQPLSGEMSPLLKEEERDWSFLCEKSVVKDVYFEQYSLVTPFTPCGLIKKLHQKGQTLTKRLTKCHFMLSVPFVLPFPLITASIRLFCVVPSDKYDIWLHGCSGSQMFVLVSNEIKTSRVGVITDSLLWRVLTGLNKCQEISRAPSWLNADSLCTVSWCAHLRFDSGEITVIWRPYFLLRLHSVCFLSLSIGRQLFPRGTCAGQISTASPAVCLKNWRVAI